MEDLICAGVTAALEAWSDVVGQAAVLSLSLGISPCDSLTVRISAEMTIAAREQMMM